MTPPSTAHARTVSRGVAPRAPRRVSGPSRAAGGGKAARARATATPAAAAARMSGGAVALPRTHVPLAHRIGRVSESHTLDRLLRSRGWILVLAVLLIGLVFMQVSLLKLNAGMGSAVERAAELDKQNALLSAEVAKLESNDRIQEWALGTGHMMLPSSDNVGYLGVDGKRVGGVAGMPSQGDATTALLPTVPTDGVEGGTADPNVLAPAMVEQPQTITTNDPGAATTATPPAVDPAATATATPQAPVTPDPATTGAATSTPTTTTTDPGTTAAPPATDPGATTAATGGVSVGGATPGG